MKHVAHLIGRSVTLLSLVALLVLALFSFQPGAVAQGDEDSLKVEANRLAYEIVDLKARRKTAEGESAALQMELEALDNEISAAGEGVRVLEQELAERQDAYNLSVRSLYERGDISELEVLLGSEELGEMWEDVDCYRRMMASEGEVLDELKGKLQELDLKKRDLRETKQKRGRLAETLNVEVLDSRICELETRLSDINTRLRAIHGNGESPRQPAPDPTGWTVPPPGKLLDRVPVSPPLSDFECTGMTFSGYTTSYGSDFNGLPTASGVIFNMNDYTCAHRALPFGTWLLVTFRGRQAIVQVNDRGPFVPGRVLDLSEGAARSIGLGGVQWTDFEILVPRGG